MDKQLQPKLRFPEFRGDWESDKFKSYVKLNQGLQIPISERFTEYVPNSYFYITNEFLNKNSSKSYYIVNPSNSVICKESDILMTRTGNTGKVVTNVKGAFHNNFFKISYNSNVYKDFLYFYLIHPKIQHIILSRAGTSTIPDLNHSDFYSINFVHPSLTEQQKIADYLTTIDKKIELLEEKKTELSRYKKAMMQKLFSQEIRFKPVLSGVEGDERGNDFPKWEEKRLGDLLSIPNKIKPNELDMNKLLTVKLHLRGVHKNESTDGLINGATNYYIRNAGQFIYGKQNLFNGGFGIIPEELDGFMSSGDVPSLDINKNLLVAMYLFYYFSRENFYKKLESLSSGTGSKRIHESILFQIQISIPSLPEQQKIADFLSAIDESITKVEEQIKETQNFKKAMLQQMFV